MNDSEFITTFNEFYPFERYILKTPVQINDIFDDLVLTELFIPNTEIKPITDDNGDLITFTKFNNDEIYIKVKGKFGEARLAFYDFASHIREEIYTAFIIDFGKYNWQDLYVESEDYTDLKEELLNQRNLIIQKYGKCEIKSNFNITDTINLLTDEEI